MMSELVWKPKNPQDSRMWHFMDFAAKKHNQSFAHYQDLHTWSIKHPDLFWPTLAEFFNVTFDTPAKQILNQYHDMLEARWFSGATFNFAQQFLSRRDKHSALISINEDNEQLRTTLFSSSAVRCRFKNRGSWYRRSRCSAHA